MQLFLWQLFYSEVLFLAVKTVIIPETVTKLTFDTPEYLGAPGTFSGTNLNLAAQAKLKQLGYKGQF